MCVSYSDASARRTSAVTQSAVQRRLPPERHVGKYLPGRPETSPAGTSTRLVADLRRQLLRLSAQASSAAHQRVSIVAWRRGVVLSGVRRMNEVNARRDRLVLGWVTVCGHCRSQGVGARPPPPRNWDHKTIPGCAVELNTQNCAWFGSQISLITAMSFREAMPPPEPPTRGSAFGPAGGLPFSMPSVPPPAKSWLRHCLWAGIPSRYVTSQLGQLSLASLRGRLIEYQLRLGVKAGMSPLSGGR